MSATPDHDRDLARVLGEWLGEGPARAPEPPLRAALDHARAHPRRRDVLAALHTDPMPSPRGRRSVFGLQPVTTFAVLALTLATVAGAVWVGTNLDGTTPVPLPTAEPTAVPMESPTPPPTAAPTPFEVVVDIRTGTAARMTVRVVDQSGRLVAARSGPPADGGSVPIGMLQVDNVDERTVRLTWTDSVCSIDYRLDIEPGPAVQLMLTAPPCEGDTMALDRVLVLEFDGPIAAESLKAGILEASPAPTPAPTPF